MTSTARPQLSARALRTLAALAAGAAACGCAALKPATAPTTTTTYSLDAGTVAVPAVPRAQAAASAPALIVGVPRAAPGFDGRQIVYVRKPHAFEHFAYSEWADAPARMLAAPMVAALGRSAHFAAVVAAPTSVSADLRLDVEIVRLQHEFLEFPSRVRLALRVQLVALSDRAVLASRDIESTALAPSEDAYGGVVAANAALRQVLEELVAFCVQIANPREGNHTLPVGGIQRR